MKVDAMVERPKISMPQNDDELLAMSDDDIRNATCEFSFDVEKCHERLKTGDDWQAVVQAHLFYDHVLSSILGEAMSYPDEVDLDRTSFATKLDLAAGFGLITRQIKSYLKRVNKIRNDIAHNLAFEVKGTDYDNLRQLSADNIRVEIDRLITENNASQMEAVLFINLFNLDIIRQGWVASRLKQRRDEEKLKRVLATVRKTTSS